MNIIYSSIISTTCFGLKVIIRFNKKKRIRTQFMCELRYQHLTILFLSFTEYL
jgi:hypothetical protein